jgi:lysozyme
MQLSTAGLNFIKQSEGFRSHTYLDAAGLPTIGYGHRLLHAQSFPAGISESDAAALLAADVRDAEQAVQRLVKVSLNQGQFDALVDFCFNLGQGRLASSTLLKVLNAGRYATAAEQLLLWDQAGGKPLAALKARREGELNLWNSAPNQSSQTAA